MHHWNPLAFVVLGCGAATATILIVYLVKRPAIDMKVKLWLLLGLGVFPALTAGSSTVVGMEATTHREFCGSCHVMTAHYEDASDPHAQSLAARHSRNPFFGDRSCYVCHADYGMYGYAMTKAGGLRHVYMYYLGGYMHMPLEEAKKTIRLVKAYDNLNCRQCHTATLRDWRRIPDHESLKAQLDSNQVSCASAGCHGFAHPFTKSAYAGVLVPGRAGGPDTVPPPSAALSGKPSSGMPSSSAAPRRDMPQLAPSVGQP